MATEDSSGSKALARVDDAVRSLKQVAQRAANLDEAATRLAAYGNEQNAAFEEVRAAMDSVAAGVEETSSVIQGMARAQAALSDTAKDVLLGLDGTSSGLTE